MQTYVLGTKNPIRKIAKKSGLTGLGISDSAIYALDLERISCYRNTYFHTDPFLDLMDNESVKNYSSFDFVICSDVLEHVAFPSIHGFENLRRLVKPGGVLILSVPFLDGYETIEHFPNLRDGWALIEQSKADWILVNPATETEREEVLRNLTFHDGSGALLEMRIFGEGDLMSRLRYCGFEEFHILVPDKEEIGYVWPTSHHPNGRAWKSFVIVCK